MEKESKELKNSDLPISSNSSKPSYLEKTKFQTPEYSVDDLKIQQLAILNTLPDMAWLKDNKARFVMTNRLFLDACGRDEENLIGKTDLEVWSKDLAEKYYQDDLKVIKSKKSMTVEDVFVDVNGNILYVQFFRSPVINPEGEIIGLTGVLHDVTLRRKNDEMYKKSEERYRKLSAFLRNQREEERSRLSQEINEELGQILSILKFDLAWVEEQIKGGDESIHKKIQSISKLIASVLEWVRRISQELRPSMLDNLGLVPAIEWEMKEFKKRTGINYTLSINQPEFELEEYVATEIFRILQEVLSNIFTHPQSKNINIYLTVKKSMIIFIVEGMRTISHDPKLKEFQSFGLISIKERVRFINGTIKINNRDDLLTTVIVELPYKFQGVSND